MTPYRFPEAAGVPSVGISPDLVEGPDPLYRRVSLSAPTVGRILTAMGQDRNQIVVTSVWASALSEQHNIEPPGHKRETLLVENVYANHFGRTVTVHMGGVANTLRRRPPKPNPEIQDGTNQALAAVHKQQIRRASDVSVHVVEALSHMADRDVVTPKGLKEERAKAETRIRAAKYTTRALGSLAATAAAAAVAYFNHKAEGGLSEYVIDGGLIGASAAAWWIGMAGAAAAVKKQIHHNTIHKLWPADRRAKRWQLRYMQARSQGRLPEIVTYELN